MVVFMKKILKCIFIVIGVLFVLFCGLVVYIIIDTNKQEELLDNEISELLELDLTIDEVDNDIVTSDEYGIVERAIKDYFNDYSDNCKRFISAIEGFDFEEMFSLDTFLDDGPDFIVSKGKLSQLNSTVSECLDNLINMSSEEYIMDLINDKNIDEYYVDLYREYMLGEGIYSFDEYMADDIEDMVSIRDDIDLFLNDCYAIYDFMSENRSYWYVEGDTVYFSTDSLVNEYNALLNKIIIDIDELVEYEDSLDNDGNSGIVGDI